MSADHELKKCSEKAAKEKLTVDGLLCEASDDLEEETEPVIKKKSGARKDENHLIRKDQISSYNSKVLREDRERRLRLRNGEPLLESPKKKKCVSFAGSETIQRNDMRAKGMGGARKT